MSHHTNHIQVPPGSPSRSSPRGSPHHFKSALSHVEENPDHGDHSDHVFDKAGHETSSHHYNPPKSPSHLRQSATSSPSPGVPSSPSLQTVPKLPNEAQLKIFSLVRRGVSVDEALQTAKLEEEIHHLQLSNSSNPSSTRSRRPSQTSDLSSSASSDMIKTASRGGSPDPSRVWFFQDEDVDVVRLVREHPELEVLLETPKSEEEAASIIEKLLEEKAKSLESDPQARASLVHDITLIREVRDKYKASSVQEVVLPSPVPRNPHAFDGKQLETLGVYNFRDFATLNPKIFPCTLFRTGTPAKANADAVSILLDHLHIKTIIDLRDGAEALTDGGSGWVRRAFLELNLNEPSLSDFDSPPPVDRRFLYRASFDFNLTLALTLLSEASWRERSKIFGNFVAGIASSSRRKTGKSMMISIMNRLGLAGLSMLILENKKDTICKVLKVLSFKQNLPALFHCSHGKDRTGTIAALVHSVCGTPREEILYDYSLSDEPARNPDGMKRWEKYPELDVEHWSHARPENMAKILEFLDMKYGGVYSYLDSIGFDEDWRARMRASLLDSS